MAKNPRRTVSPAIPESDDPASQALKEWAEVADGQRGQQIDRVVRFRDLEEAGFARIDFPGGRGGRLVMRPGRNIVPIGPFEPDPGEPPDFGQDNLDRPPAPTGVRARGLSLDAIGVSWNPPNYPNPSYTEVFASQVNSWDAIRDTFNEASPIGPGNQTPYFMGRAGGTTFLHRGLSSTIPALNLRRDLVSISFAGGQVQATVASGAELASPGDTAYLASDSPWDGNGVQGEVLSVDGNTVTFASSAEFDIDLPAGAQLGITKETDDLDAALNPSLVYYWVRFVSTAGIAGPVQGEEGAPGSVMVNPEEVLNILTGRIRESQLANELITPINFIRGPITEVDGDGNRRFPTVRDFVLSLGSDLVSEYDEDLERIFLGYLGGSDFVVAPARIVEYERSNATTFFITTASPIPEAAVGQFIRIFAPPGTLLGNLASQPGQASQQLQVGLVSSAAGLSKYRIHIQSGSATAPDVPITEIEDATAIGTEAEMTNPGIAAAAAFVRNVAGQTSGAGAWIQSLETLQAAFESEDEDSVTGIRRIISTLEQKALVTATNDGALAHISDNLQVEFGDDGEGNPVFVALNSVTNAVRVIDETVNQSFTVRLQQQVGGILYAAGFGLGLEGDLSGNVTSTFAVAADQFAVMSPGQDGHVLADIHTSGGLSRYRIEVNSSDASSFSSAIQPGKVVVFAIPPNAPAKFNPLRGQSFVVDGGGSFNPSFPHFYVRHPDGDNLPDIGSGGINVPVVSQGGFAVFPEQSIPFIINTSGDTPVVGIRGRLVVDGMITATDAEITNLLTAENVWAQSITNFGLLRTKSLVGEVIATPRWGGWAIKMRSPQSANTRVFEYSQWTPEVNDNLPGGDDQVNPENLYPQLRGDVPVDTSFFLDAVGNVFVRGNLTVAGNARIWTGHQATADNYVQMDSEFPIFVMPGADSPWGNDERNLVHTDDTRAIVRDKALFWVEKTGIMGFNTQNGAIFAGDTPLEPPSGRGFVTVKSRLDGGETEGMGRVFGSMQFGLLVNAFSPDSNIGIQYQFFLADASTNYGRNPNTGAALGYVNVPSQRSGSGFGYSLTPAEAQFMDTHFIILRGTSEGTDPYQDAWNNWIGLHGSSLREFAHWYDIGAGMKNIMGAVETPASPHYRLLVVIGERWQNNGDPIYGEVGPKVLPYQANAFVQQISNTSYEGDVGSNTGSTGSGAPPTNPNDPLPPGDPVAPGNPIILP